MKDAKQLADTFISFLEKHGSLDQLGEVIEALNIYYEREIKKQDVAIVRTATMLSDTEQSDLISHLREIFGRNLSLDIRVDSSVVGGFSVQVGDVVIDKTLRSKLVEVKNALLR